MNHEWTKHLSEPSHLSDTQKFAFLICSVYLNLVRMTKVNHDFQEGSELKLHLCKLEEEKS